MQTTLLGVAIAIILALVTALVAPLVVDWNHYRGAVEAEASRLSGLSVHVNGAIDARLLPSPVITLHDIDAGEIDHQPRLRAGMLKVELALGPLLRGKMQASEVHLIAPQVSLSFDRSGAIEMPMPSSSFNPEALSISRFSVEDGRATLTEGSGARLLLQQLYFKGDIRSLFGPFSGDGAVVAAGELYGYRISGSRADGGAIKIRLGVESSNRPLTTDWDGTLTFNRGVPQFDGTLAVARPAGATLANGQRVTSVPWRAEGAIKATPAVASLRNLTFRYGPEERAINFTGTADLTFGAHSRLDGNVAAMQVDVDRALAAPDVTNRPPLVELRSFFQTFVAWARLPVPAQIGVSVGAVTIGGTAIESLQGSLQYDQTGWSLSKFQLHAPGMTDFGLSGRLTSTPQGFSFSGPATLGSADLDSLLVWLNGHSGGDRVAGGTKTISARGDVTIASDRIAIEQLMATLGREKLEGQLAYNWPTDKHPARLDAQLRAGDLNLDALSSFAKAAVGGDGFALPQEAVVALDIGKATLAGVDAQAVKAHAKLDAGTLQIDQLSIGNLAGAKLDVSGRIDELSSQPRGQVTLDLDARALDGLGDIVAKFAPRFAGALRRAADRVVPAKVHAALIVQRAPASGSTAQLQVNGNLAAMRLTATGVVTGEPSQFGSANIKVDTQLNAADGSALVALLGLDRIVGVDQLPGLLTVSAAGPLNGDLHVDGKVAASGLGSTIQGTLRLSGDSTPWAKLKLQATAGDLRPLHQVMTGQPGTAVPVRADATLAIDGSNFSFTDIAATVGKSKVSGAVAVGLDKSPISIDGNVEADEIDGVSALAMLLGLPSNVNGGTSVSSDRIGAGAFTAMNGGVTFKLARAVFTPALVASDLAGAVHFHPSMIAFDAINGSLAGGRVSGAMAFNHDPDGVAAHGKIEVADAAAATILGPNLNASDGQLTLTLQTDGFGASPFGLIGSLHGSGVLDLKNIQIVGLDPAAFDAAMQAAGQSGPIDVAKVQAAISAALAKGHLTVPEGSAPIDIRSGTLNLKDVTLDAQGGSKLALNGAVDLSNAAINARMTLSEPPPPSALLSTPLELSVSIKGPFMAPQRTLDTTALMNLLTLRAAELQSRRIQSIEASRYDGLMAPAIHPDAPDVRVAPPGAVVESAVPPNLLAAPVPGVRGVERLQQPAAPPPPPLPEQSGPGPEGATPAVPLPMPAPIVIRPSQPRAAPHTTKNTATLGTAEPTRRRPAPPLPLVPTFSRAD